MVQTTTDHYHAIIFNCPDPQLFSDAWGLGNVVVGSVTGDSIAYTMKYIDKPGGKPLFPGWIPFVGRDDRFKEFPLMSKGLGKNYLTDEIVSYHKADLSRLYATKPGGHRIALPRYYRGKIYSDADLRKQVILIQETVAVQETKELQEFQNTYSDGSMSFEAWKDNKRFGRYDRFYSNQKPRNT